MLCEASPGTRRSGSQVVAVPMLSGTERLTTKVALTIHMGFVARGGDVNLDPDETITFASSTSRRAALMDVATFYRRSVGSQAGGD
jgi:hypothetical protein